MVVYTFISSKQGGGRKSLSQPFYEAIVQKQP